MLSIQEKSRLLRKSLGEPRIEKKGRGELVFLCPFCKHHKPKLSVNLQTDEFNCWTCPAENKTRGKSLFKLLQVGCSREEIGSYLDSLPKDGARRASAQVVHEPVVLPREFEPALHADDLLARQYRRYLRTRGVTDDDLALYRIGICRTGEFRGRVIFPSFDAEGELNFFTGRSVEPGGSYRTCDGNKDIVFNGWLVDWREPVTIVEGPFDMVAAGPNAIPLQGQLMLPALKSALVERSTRVYLALDQDASRRQLSIANDLFRYQVEVMLVDLPGKDPADLGRSAFADARDRARPYSELDRIRGTLDSYRAHL